jgi:hypothetical protein
MLRFALVACVPVCLAACLDLGDQIIQGSAILTGQDDSSAITVCGACPLNGGGRTCFCTSVAPDGSYWLHQEVSGPNPFTASAPSTLAAVSFSVDGDGNVVAPPVMLTPLGSVTGTISGPADLDGVIVSVDGSSNVAATDATGAFTLTNVVSGPQSLTAFQGSAAAHAAIVVPYADVATVALQLE